MFYCNACAVKNRWPESMVKSYGTCEDCGKAAVCNDMPSRALPRLETKRAPPCWPWSARSEEERMMETERQRYPVVLTIGEMEKAKQLTGDCSECGEWIQVGEPFCFVQVWQAERNQCLMEVPLCADCRRLLELELAP